MRRSIRLFVALGASCIVALCSTGVGIANASYDTSASFAVVREIPLPPPGTSVDTAIQEAMTSPHDSTTSTNERNGFSLTPEQVEETRHPKMTVYRADSAKYDHELAQTDATADNPVTHYECQQVYEGGYRGDFWVKDRFAECRYYPVLFSFYAKKGGPVIGMATFKSTILFNMQPNTREIQVAVKLFDWKFTGTIPATAKLGSEFGCMGIGLTGSTAKCDRLEQGSLRTISSWQTAQIDAWSFLPQGVDPPDPNEPAEVNTENRTLYNVAHYFYTYGGPGPYDSYNQTETKTLPFRCDTVRTKNPSYAKSSDCVFHGATGWFTMHISDPDITESAQFIWDAQNDITKTYPEIYGKYVPGIQDGKTEPLHRAYYDTKLRDANRRTSVASCVKNWGANYTVRPDGQTNDCDEYPFAATYEGSFTVTDTMIRSYAVRPLLSTHNQKVGSRLSTFVAEDHLLDGDAYFVTAMP